MMDSAATTPRNPTVDTMRRLAVHAASTALDRIHLRYQNFAEYPYQERLHTTQENFMGIFPVLKRFIYYFLVGSFLLATSMATYGLFYWIAMPAHAATEKLYFDYSCRNTEQVCSGPEKRTGNECDFSCAPSANVDIFAKHTPWQALLPDVLPEARSKTRILRPRKHYFLEVVLQLPESTTNQQIGMFAVEVELQTKGHTPLARSQRSARLPHESGWIGIIRKSLCLAPLLVGALTESRTSIVPSFRHFVESTKHPLQHVVVKLVSQGSSWRGSNIPIEVIAGELRIGKELNVFQSVLKEWFWTSFLVGTTIILLFQCLFYIIGSFLWEAWAENMRRHREEVDLGETPYFFDSAPPPSTTAAQQGNPFSDEDGDDGDQWEEMPPVGERAEHSDVGSVGPAPDLTGEQHAASTTPQDQQPTM